MSDPAPAIAPEGPSETPPREAALIVNSRSRRGRELFRAAQSALTAGGLTLRESVALRDPAAISPMVERAIEAGVPLVIVGGGDGTLSGVARHFVDRPATLGVLPLGTGNQFARDLGITADLEAACHALIEGRTATVDVGTVGNGYFLNVATVGLTTLVAAELQPEAKRRWGRLVYLFAMVRALRRVRPFHARLVTPDGATEFETLQVVIGNGRYHAGPFPLAPEARITEGKLTVYALATTRKWDLLQYAARLPGGRHVDLPQVPAFTIAHGELITTPSQRVTVDGEIRLRTPLTFGVLPGALRVRVPAEWDGGRT